MCATGVARARFIRMRVLGGALALVLVAASAAAASTEQLTPSFRGSDHLTAYAGHVVWSQYEPASQTWTLQQFYRGRQTRLPVHSREVPFDVDAGPDTHGRPVIVYSRCALEPTTGRRLFPDWGASRACHIYELPLGGTGHERLLRRVVRPNRSDTTPTIWGRRLAFARRTFHLTRRGYVGRSAHVVLSVGRRLWRLGRGPVGRNEAPVGQTSNSVGAMDLGPHLLALLWYGFAEPGYPQAGVIADRLTSTRHRTIDRAFFIEGGPCDADTVDYDVNSPNVVGNRVVFVHDDLHCDRSASSFVSSDFATRSTFSTAPSIVIAMARDGATTYWVAGAGSTDPAQIGRAHV